MGCGCGRKRSVTPKAAPTLRQMKTSASISYVLVSSSGSEVETFETLDAARAAWSKYRQEKDSGARLLQRTVTP